MINVHESGSNSQGAGTFSRELTKKVPAVQGFYLGFAQRFYLGLWEATFFFTFGKIYHKNGKISTKIHEIGKIKAIFGLGMTPI